MAQRLLKSPHLSHGNNESFVQLFPFPLLFIFILLFLKKNNLTLILGKGDTNEFVLDGYIVIS